MENDEPLVQVKLDELQGQEVVLVWGGWSCGLGYIHWAYVAKFVDCKLVNTDCPGSEKIGAKLFEAPKREDVTNPKNCHYNDTPAPFPQPVCLLWIRDNKCKLVTTVKMRTD